MFSLSSRHLGPFYRWSRMPLCLGSSTVMGEHATFSSWIQVMAWYSPILLRTLIDLTQARDHVSMLNRVVDVLSTWWWRATRSVYHLSATSGRLRPRRSACWPLVAHMMVRCLPCHPSPFTIELMFSFTKKNQIN